MAFITPPLTKISSPTAAGVCQEYQPHPEAKALLTPNQTPSEYLQTLQQHQMSEDSIKFLAHGMSERESTWWATQSAQKVANPANAADQAAIKAADAWVKNPSPATQQAAAAAAAKTDYQTPGAWAAQAAAWSQPVPAPAVPGAPALSAVPGAPVVGAVPGTPALPAIPGAPAPGAGPGSPALAAAPMTPTLPGKPALPAAPAVPRLTPHAVSGAVMLAAAMSAKPPTVPKVQVPERPAFEKPTLTAPHLTAPKPPIPEKPVLPPTPQQRAATAKIHEPYIKMGTDIASGRNTWG